LVTGSLVPVTRKAAGGLLIIGFHELVLLGLGLIELPESRFVHEGKVRVVERIFHHPQRCGVPTIVELVDAPVGRVAVLRQVGDRQQRVLERDPRVSVAGFAMESPHPRVGQRLVG
jgi:hypothetical protein